MHLYASNETPQSYLKHVVCEHIMNVNQTTKMSLALNTVQGTTS